MRTRAYMLFALGIGMACVLGMCGTVGPGAALAGEGHAHGMSHGPAATQHERLEIGDTPAPPTVKLTVSKDPKAGWNVRVQVENFRFAPEHASTPHVPGEGHAHLYVDGKRIARLYGEWFHIPTLAPGTRKITVTLNANSHEDLAVKGKTVSDGQEVRVPAR